LEQNAARGRFEKPRIEECIDKLNALMSGHDKRKCAVVKLYLTNFKSYNDTFGYTFGGRLINEITAYLGSINDVDSYHIRGVEYILIVEKPSRQAVENVMDAVMQRFEDTWHIDNVVCACSVNAGIVYLPGDAQSPNEVLEQLGTAISESSQLGKNYLVEYNDGLIKRYQRRNAIAQHIPQAIKDGTLELWFSPTYDVSKKRYTRIDCRIRMFCEGYGVIKETELISAAEQSGQTGVISIYALSKICGLISELKSKKVDFETVAMKIPLMQLLQDRFVSDLSEMIEKAGIPASCLGIEVDEATANSSFPRMYTCMTALSEMGVEMILADYGTGALGINSVLSMSIDVVKINRQLIWQIDNTSNGSSMIESLIHLSGDVGLKFVAEGVESESQAKILEQLGCNYMKGLYFTGVLNTEELIALLSGAK